MTTINGVSSQPVKATLINKSQLPDDVAERIAETALDEEMKKASEDVKTDKFEKEGAETKPKKKRPDMAKIAWVALASIGGGTLAMRFMPVVRRLSTKVLAALAESGVKIADKVGKKYPKMSFNSEKALTKIASVKKELIEGNSKNLYNKVRNSIQEILGIEIKTASPVLAGIKNDVGFIDAGLATGFGYATAGRAAMKDDKEISKKDIAQEMGKIILVAT